jgi:hypothetical protein
MTGRVLSAADLFIAGFAAFFIDVSAAAAQTNFAQQVASAPTYKADTLARGAANQPLDEPAPMPDADIFAPVPHVDDPKAAHLTPNLFRPKTQFRGDGYSPGSTAQESQERTLKPAPGISLKVPLD